MATYNRRKEVQTTERIVYKLPNPANWTEVEKVLAACERDLENQRCYDDSVKVEADEDSIKFIVVTNDNTTTK